MRAGYWAIGLSVLLPACGAFQTHPDWVHKPAPGAVQHVLSGEALPGGPVRESEWPEADLFELSPTMKTTADQLAIAYPNDYGRAQALHRRLLGSPLQGGFGVQYSADVTLPADQAFSRREVNCLSYTLMYVAMARRMGLEAQVNEVELPPSWDLRENDSLMLLRHVNAKVTLGEDDQVVVDLEMERYSPVYRQSVVSGDAAAALFYNNRGMELMARKQTRESFLHLRKALALDGTRSYIWNNLGNLYYRQGLLDQAETAYLQGLSIGPRDLTIMSNLSNLYGALDKPDKADYFERRAREHRNDNPYYIYTRARTALEEGDTRRAEDLVLEAMDKQNREPRFYSLAAQIYERLGDNGKAETMRRQAEKLEQDLFL